MSWSKPFTDIETAYIKDSYPRLSCREIARKLGRSQRGVENVVKRMGLRDKRERRARARTRETDDDNQAELASDNLPDDVPQNELVELRQLRRILKRTLREGVDPRSVPKLSAEYREVLRRISELEEEGEGGSSQETPQGVELGSLLVSVPLQPS